MLEIRAEHPGLECIVLSIHEPILLCAAADSIDGLDSGKRKYVMIFLVGSKRRLGSSFWLFLLALPFDSSFWQFPGVWVYCDFCVGNVEVS